MPQAVAGGASAWPAQSCNQVRTRGPVACTWLRWSRAPGGRDKEVQALPNRDEAPLAKWEVTMAGDININYDANTIGEGNQVTL